MYPFCNITAQAGTWSANCFVCFGYFCFASFLVLQCPQTRNLSCHFRIGIDAGIGSADPLVSTPRKPAHGSTLYCLDEIDSGMHSVYFRCRTASYI